MSMRTGLGLVVALVVAFAASPAFAIYTGVTINGGNAREIGSMTISLPGQAPAPVQRSKTEDQRKLGAWFIDTPQAATPGVTATVQYTDRDGRRQTMPVLLGDNGFVIDLPAVAAGSSSATSMAATGGGIQVQLDGFAGVAFANGHAPATAGFDGAVLFPLGNRVLVGPTAGFKWVNSSMVQTIGGSGGATGSTFSRTSVGLNAGNIGAVVAYGSGPWRIDIHGGVTIADAAILQQEGVCGGSAGPGCTVFSATTSHDTVVGPTVGARLSHKVLSRVGVFVEYDYTHLEDTSVSPTSGAKTTIFDLNESAVVAGISWYFH